jgi:hypothetical protein
MTTRQKLRGDVSGLPEEHNLLLRIVRKSKEPDCPEEYRLLLVISKLVEALTEDNACEVDRLIQVIFDRWGFQITPPAAWPPPQGDGPE